MNPSTSKSSTSANSDKPQIDWVKVIEIVITILTLGLGHLRKHHKTPAEKGTRQ